MKKFVAPMLLLFAGTLLRSQTALEIGLQGMQYLNRYDLQQADNSLNTDGSACGIRFGAVAGKNLLQASFLYSRIHGPQQSNVTKEQALQNNSLTRVGLGMMLLARHHFKPNKKVFAFISAGASGFVFNRIVHYNAAAGPDHPGQSGTNKYNLAAVLVPGLRCTLHESFFLDLEPAMNYYFSENNYYKNNLSFSLGVTLNYMLTRRNRTTATE